MFERHLDVQPFDRAMLGVFAELVRADGNGTVADIGCGPGRITTYLDELGLDVFGIDLSPEMIRLARAAHPQLRFDKGTMEELALADGSLSGIVAWYSIIHTPPERMPNVVGEFRRVLVEGGHLLLGFMAVDDSQDVQPYDHKVAQASVWPLRALARLLHDGGFEPVARMLREPEGEERTRHGYLLVRKSGTRTDQSTPRPTGS
ncbi:methyltransferase domain-containing protein [Nocardia transvalensis]|nr:methyltransferase domain-containing protein [Nocardia transvalensis]